MVKKLFFLLVLYFVSLFGFAQEKLRVIKADSITVDIRDGASFNKAACLFIIR